MYVCIYVRSFIELISLGGVRLSALGPLYQHLMMDDAECGAGRGMTIGRGNRRTLTKPASVPLCPKGLPHALTEDRNRTCRCGEPATNCLSYGTALWL
jgi:hypothetical protein